MNEPTNEPTNDPTNEPANKSATVATAPPEAAKWAAIWAESLSQVLGQIQNAVFPCATATESPAELPPATGTDLWLVCAASGGLRGEMSLRLPAATAIRLAGILMGEPAAAASEASAVAAPSAEQTEATLELFRQVAGLAASALKPQWGEVLLPMETAAGAPSWPSSSTAWIRAGENPGWVLELHLSAALGAALRAEKANETQAAVHPAMSQPATTEDSPGSTTASLAPSPSVSSAALSSASSSASSPPASAPSGNASSANAGGADVASAASKVSLDLLMDVELALTLRFGSRRLPLGEILDLNPGSVIELDRQVEDPVDVLLDGRVVARGEVVVMDGNYGVRVTEIGPAPGA